ncbi:hypothetical protein [Streptomyces orinoci]|uniref:Uncharacterized protein n=1 Tax=Streptomyces orinoci TaxID=67339 RepID=A0ABV3K297_STRON|nr:hypothetical protein [Streptomyces orinoci]
MSESNAPAAPVTPAVPAADHGAPLAPDAATAPPAAAPALAAPVIDPAAEQRLTVAEQAAQQAAAERDEVLAALRRVLDPDGAAAEADPARLAEQAAAERDAARAEARQLRVELAAHQAAHTVGADPARLLDSRTVEKQLAALDPDDKQFGDKLAAVIADAVKAAPHLRAEAAPPAGPARGGADFTPAAPATPTAEQFVAMTYGERVALHQSDPDLYARLSAASQ